MSELSSQGQTSNGATAADVAALLRDVAALQRDVGSLLGMARDVQAVADAALWRNRVLRALLPAPAVAPARGLASSTSLRDQGAASPAAQGLTPGGVAVAVNTVPACSGTCCVSLKSPRKATMVLRCCAAQTWLHQPFGQQLLPLGGRFAAARGRLCCHWLLVQS